MKHKLAIFGIFIIHRRFSGVMAEPRAYRVERAVRAGDKAPKGVAVVLRALKTGEVVTTRALYERIGSPSSVSTTRDGAMARLRVAMSFAKERGIVSEVAARPVSPHKEFLRTPPVARWIETLNRPNVIHATSRANGTRHAYGYALYRFNQWLAGRTWTVAVRVSKKDGSYKEVRREVEMRGVEHLLEMALEKGGLDRDMSGLIRQYFAAMNTEARQSGSVMLQAHSAIKSFFTSHEIQYSLHLPRSMMRGAGSSRRGDDWEDRTLKMSEFARMLTVGKPTTRDKAVLLSKFHRGLDLSTMADRFNYTAFDQMCAHMGTDDIRSWDLDKCPVPIVLTRVKTDYKHVGFLERDAVAANMEWIEERERLTGSALRRGDGQPLYLTQHGKPIRAPWVASRFSRLAILAGLCTERDGGKLSTTRHSHQLRHLLKSTLIDSGCRIDVADHVIGHSPKDTYERQASLYADSLRREYAKAAAKINIFTNFETSIDAGSDIHQLRADVEADRKRLKEALTRAEAAEGRDGGRGGGDGGDGGIPGPVAEMIAALQGDMRRMQGLLDARGGGGGGGNGSAAAGIEYQCAACSLIHSSGACPSCGSAERRVYNGGGAGGGGART